MYKAAMAYPNEVEKPADLAAAIDLAFDLEALKDAGARFGLDDLSEGAWSCLLGIQTGRNRAEREKIDKLNN
jgi:hypothetical protein